MDHETMTPLVAWGAGIRPRHNHRPQHQSFADFYGGDFANFLRNTETVDVKQADLAPLMSTLIGTKSIYLQFIFENLVSQINILLPEKLSGDSRNCRKKSCQNSYNSSSNAIRRHLDMKVQ